MNPRIIIADDHPLFVMGLKYALSGQGLEVIAEAKNGQEAIELCSKHKPDVMVMDVKMPHTDGITACKHITTQHPGIIVIMLTTFEEPGVIQAAEKAGAKGYFSKETDPRELADKIKQILQFPKRHYMPRVRIPQLSARENEVLTLLSQGLSNKDMAKHLGLSADTIKDHLERLYGKLEANDRISALNKARELGLIRQS
jgi:two-component system, NarL family, nitrate/nitrite response regulator NarL